MITPLVVFVWLLNVLSDSGGQLAFKAAAVESAEHCGLAQWKYMARKRWIWVGIAFYVAEFFSWVAFLSLMELSVGVMIIAFNIVVVVLAGRILFNERLTACRLAGISLITIGVVVVGWGAG